MDLSEATIVVFSRIQALDPYNAAKIMGLLLIQDDGANEMIRLAFGPETHLNSVVLKARKDLALLSSSPFYGGDFIDDLGSNGRYCDNASSCKFLHAQRAATQAAMADSVSRQIYLTFPAESSFSQEDVSNYFSIYGPVQDVRIPYQQKRMFGFVSFVYPETVRLVLAQGNPHFVCDARVLVKPYKEKGKVINKPSSTALDSGDLYHLQQLEESRMLYGSCCLNEMVLRRELEEQQQQAIELQGRQLMGLQLHDLKMPSTAISNAELSSPSEKSSSSSPCDASGFSRATDPSLHGLLQTSPANFAGSDNKGPIGFQKSEPLTSLAPTKTCRKAPLHSPHPRLTLLSSNPDSSKHPGSLMVKGWSKYWTETASPFNPR